MNVTNNEIHVVLAADSNYAKPLAVAICSVAANCDAKRGLVFNVIQSSIGKDLRKKIESSLEHMGSQHARINWLDAPLERITEFKLARLYTTCLTFARLFIQDMLPFELERVLYLDCDIVANEDVAELWDTDFGGKSLLAVRDAIGTVSQPGGLVNYRELGIPADAHYFNAGVLLINLKKWRESCTAERVVRYLNTHRTIIQLADQEALNAVLWDDWGELDYRWNWQIMWRAYQLGRAKMSWTPDTNRKSIIHFTTEEKPWLPGCDYEEKKYFLEYLDRTEWAGLQIPLWREVYGRSKRNLGEIRDALGMLRRALRQTIIFRG